MSRIAMGVVLTFAATTAVTAGGCYVVADRSSGDEGSGAGSGGSGGTGGGQSGAPRGTGASGYDTGSAVPGNGAASGIVAGTGGEGPWPDRRLPPAPSPQAGCPAVTVSRFNELMIVDPLVTNDARASDRSAYRPWSFRQRIEALVPDAADAAGALADAWLAQWASLREVPASTANDAATIPIDPRPAAEQVLRCLWLRVSPESGCDASCTSCRSRRGDLAQSPFRLLAIVNRGDLATRGGAVDSGSVAAAACGSDGGELRFIYGAADPDTLRALPFTVIFEYAIALRPGETMRDWAAAWHGLGALPLGGRAFNARLDEVVAAGLARATLRRVLTNEVAFGAADGLPWEMRQFVPALTDAGTIRLVEVATSGTPRLTVAAAPDLGRWIDANGPSILAGQNPLPSTMLAASAPIPSKDFSWRTAASDAATGAAFNRNTCNGCHGGRTDSADVPFQHVAPASSATYYGALGSSASARLSRYLHDPGHDDELGRREHQLAAALCTPCGPAAY